MDLYLVNLATGKATNVTAVERVSFYNGGLFFWPHDRTKLGFTALVNGNSHPFRMDRDGRNKVDLTKESNEFAYGFSSSPDGRHVAYHKSYQVFLVRADGANPIHVPTGRPFNFAPIWSPDGQWVLFLSGEHYNCHPYLVRADGTGLTKLADRGGYRGVIEFLDVYDFHGGSSDTPVWSADGKSVFYTAQVQDSVELYQVTLDGLGAAHEVGRSNAALSSATVARWEMAAVRLETRRRAAVAPDAAVRSFRAPHDEPSCRAHRHMAALAAP